MRWVMLAAATGLAMTARGSEPAAPARVIEVEEDAALAWVLGQPNLQDDVLNLHSILLVHMERRGVKTARLSEGCLDRLRLALTKSSDEAPTEFHFFTRAAAGFDDDWMTRVFAALHDDAPGFAKFVRSQVLILPKKKSEPVPGAPADAPPTRDLNAEYERYMAQTTLMKDGSLNIEMAEGGCSMQTLFDGEKGASCSGGSSSVVVGGGARAVGAALPETSAPREDRPGAVDASGSLGARFIGGAGR